MSVKTNQKLLNNPIVRAIYSCKIKIDIATVQVSWFTAKLPETMSAIFLAEKAGIYLTKDWVVWLLLIMLVGLFLFGFVWKWLGMYDVEVFTNAEVNPWQEEVLAAARKINGESKDVYKRKN